MNKSLICFVLIFLSLSINSFSQTKINKKQFVNKIFWTKFVLATEGNCKIEITLSDISPSKKKCGFDSHIKTGAKIKLIDLSDEKNWARLKFQNEEKKEFEVFIVNDSKRNFKKSFNLAFSAKKMFKDDFYPRGGKLDTKLNVVKNLGFPTSIERDRTSEKWTFGADWIYWNFYNYDETYIYLENDRVVKINGII